MRWHTCLSSQLRLSAERSHEWLKTSLSLLAPKSETAAPIRYALGLWDTLMRYLDDGRIEIDNLIAERALRPVAMGRSLCPSF